MKNNVKMRIQKMFITNCVEETKVVIRDISNLAHNRKRRIVLWDIVK